KTREERRMSSLQRALFASTRDVRVILIKLADKLHNLRTLKYFPKSKQVQIAQEALEVYAPIAEKLELTQFRKEIQDICFSLTKPKICSKIKKKMEEKSKNKKKEMDLLIKKLRPELKKSRIEARFIKRDRDPYQVFQKMTKTFKSLNEIYDCVFLVIITDSIPQCYEVLGIIHTLYKPLPLKFKDYIAIPQSSLYQSIHTAVIGPKGKPIKIYIRTNEMEEKAQKGILFLVERHGDIKETSSLLYNLTELDMHSLDDSEFMDLLKEDLLEDRIFVFSNNGEMIELPKDSTPIDFAFHIDPALGKKALRSVVNGRIVPLWHKLRNGDIVEVIPSSKERRDVTWLGFTKSHKARKEITRMIKEKKPNNKKVRSTLVNVKFKVLNRIGMLHDLTGAFASHNVNLVSVSMHSAPKTTLTDGTVTVEVTSPKKFERTINKLKKLKGVMEVQTSYLT
ncbi:HD domain-containing protein, partial [Candidatus Micrarchaeota archaeon]|nr:HD domain-containing protein [Candidatus Micrarchaeota archaeon]